MSTTKTLMTAEEFAKTGPETDGFELVRGELVTMPPPKPLHGQTCINVGTILKLYVKRIGRGRVYGNDTGLITEKGPDTVRGVDIMFFAEDPSKSLDPKRYLDTPPQLAVEVRSPDQGWKPLFAKVHEYLDLGSPMVWIVDPVTCRLHVFEPDREPTVYAAENAFDGGDVLPGLHFQVAEMFE